MTIAPGSAAGTINATTGTASRFDRSPRRPARSPPRRPPTRSRATPPPRRARVDLDSRRAADGSGNAGSSPTAEERAAQPSTPRGSSSWSCSSVRREIPSFRYTDPRCVFTVLVVTKSRTPRSPDSSGPRPRAPRPGARRELVAARPVVHAAPRTSARLSGFVERPWLASVVAPHSVASCRLWSNTAHTPLSTYRCDGWPFPGRTAIGPAPVGPATARGARPTVAAARTGRGGRRRGDAPQCDPDRTFGVRRLAAPPTLSRAMRSASCGSSNRSVVARPPRQS